MRSNDPDSFLFASWTWMEKYIPEFGKNVYEAKLGIHKGYTPLRIKYNYYDMYVFSCHFGMEIVTFCTRVEFACVDVGV